LEKEWEVLMEQSFSLVEYGRLKYPDLDQMPGEERVWWIKRIRKRQEDEEEARKS
jgi:hypothetical protein